MNKLRNLILWLLIGGYMILALGFTGRQADALRCTGIKVLIKDSLDLQFVVKEDIMKIIERSGDSIRGSLLMSVELSRLEERLLMHPAIKTAELYLGADGELKAEIIQRRPTVRIIDRDNRNYYIDKEGYFMPVTRRYSERVLVINGNIHPAWYQAGAIHLLQDEPDKELLVRLFEMAQYLYKDEFWRSQIVQLYVDAQKEIELIPRLGAHIIYFGTTDDYRDKLFKLETVYREGFRYLGWNQYGKINLKYKNQVVCTKK